MNLSLPWKWFLGLAALLAVLLLVVNLCIDLSLPPLLIGRIRGDLQREAVLARQTFASVPWSVREVNPLAHELARQTALRVTVIARDGTVIGESDKPPEALAEIKNHLYRPEVQAALREGAGSDTRRSDTIGVDLMYVAVTAGTQGFVRVALPLHEISLVTRRVRVTVALASFAVALVALPLVFWLARRFGQPVDQMRRMAARVAQGEFRTDAPEGRDELGELGRALNQMSRQLETRLKELTAEKAELNATLSNMIEGVLVVDPSSKIRLANETSLRQFGLSEAVVGKTVMEAFRSAPLQDLITQALVSGQVSARELSFFGVEERVFDVNAACLRAGSGAAAGAVVVIHDITRIKQLENVRKEFVANVSHELRTPLSIIKGYVETLLEEQPPDTLTAHQFLETIQRHSRRLEALIGDLLSISELESQQARLNLAPVSVAATAQAAIEELAQRALEKKTTVTLQFPPDLPAVRGDPQRLHQVLMNLLDNAIKYTPAGTRVTVSATAAPNEVEVCVADNGPGIAPEHLPRIFERFYRVDKARSRELGGTGLGLSIVKHIVQAHGGRVWADSTPGTGSRFYFTLPRATHDRL